MVLGLGLAFFAGEVPPSLAQELSETIPDSWAWQRLVRPPVPDTSLSTWIQTPIDAFIAKRLTDQGLTPSPRAGHPALIRRATHDLLGLLPTPEEVDRFVRDERPTAWAQLVDRLLDSPRYGERWARHWMDVAHFAETHGHDEDAIREQAWPYRDYLIRTFNTDKPYARFVQEQVAGDVLFPEDPDGVVATGFLAAGPWDSSSQMGIQDGTIDKKIAQYLDRDDMITTVMGTFMSLTVHCARCHDHKFDPILQDDYYALQAVFAGVDRANRFYDADPLIGRQRRALLEEQRNLESDRYVQEQLQQAGLSREIASWENEQSASVSAWTTMPPVSFATSGEPRAIGKVLDDDSILFSGPRPDKDTYTLQTRPGKKHITAVQLEVLSDPSLPLQGPGRQENGNLHLSEFSLSVLRAPEGEEGKTETASMTELALQQPMADFDQDGWTIAMAVDGDPKSAWGIYPQVSQNHRAMFLLSRPLETDENTVLLFRLDQLHGGGHLIGRPRVSFTEMSAPGLPEAWPENVRVILARKAELRSAADQLELARFYLTQRNRERLAELPPRQEVFAVAHDFAGKGNFKAPVQPRIVHFLKRGDIRQPGPEAEPGAVSSLPGLPGRFCSCDADEDTDSEGWRRAALARWLTDPENGLLWRSIANRVWQYHFGRGLVNTPNDFGKMGERPSHPQLLDWLACELRDHGGSLKHLHRLIMTSAVYQQTSRGTGEGVGGNETDPDPRLLARMPMRRREAEAIRDSLLQLSGTMDWTMGGPSDRQFMMSPGVHVTPNLDYAGFDPKAPANQRRSVYRFIFRTVPDPFMQVLDCPDASQWVPRRDESITPAQALAMMNNRFLIHQSELTARRLEAENPDRSAQIQRLFRKAYGRGPDKDEAMAVEAYARDHGLANACRMIMNSNEFLFVE